MVSGSGIRDPEKNLIRNPNSGVKKAPDSGFRIRNTAHEYSYPTQSRGVGLDLTGEDDGNDEPVDGDCLAEDHRNQVLRLDPACQSLIYMILHVNRLYK
jgi:hypothetical protein